MSSIHPIHPSIHPIHSSILFIHPSIHPPYSSIHSSNHPSILFIHLSIHPSRLTTSTLPTSCTTPWNIWPGLHARNATIRNKMRNLGQQSWAQYLCIVENLADLINAINWMPQGFLFGGQFSSKFTGAMGTISSLLKLYRLHASKKAS
ncbi:hypothetical protein DPMN_128701 [Dreissena polymorpha]|uniref:Uncharacterized protein n=1 Tax=Dreissena polymorpha TaxID=45954 RepID=A0A9D4JXN6_DREPO|nr:hypothetical protein DPMN_128701 [Dreissena polymorpha]